MLKLHLVIDKPGYSEKMSRARARIAIEYFGGLEGNTQFVSPDCLTYREIDYQLKTIEKNIEQMRKKAQSAFKDTP